MKHTSAIAPYFKKLNEEWIGVYFENEETDMKVLNHREEKIIDAGGEIFYVQINGKIIFTGAVMPSPNRDFELTKMATLKKYQGSDLENLLFRRL